MQQSIRQEFVFPQSLARMVQELAEREGVSKSEIVRRALEAYEPAADAIDEEELSAVIRQLVDAVRGTVERVDATLTSLREQRASRDAEREQIREEARRWARAHPREMAAVARLFGGDSP